MFCRSERNNRSDSESLSCCLYDMKLLSPDQGDAEYRFAPSVWQLKLNNSHSEREFTSNSESPEFITVKFYCRFDAWDAEYRFALSAWQERNKEKTPKTPRYRAFSGKESRL